MNLPAPHVVGRAAKPSLHSLPWDRVPSCPVNFSSLGWDWVPTHRVSPRHHQAHTGPPVTHSLSLLSFTVEAMLVLLLVGKYIGDKAEREKGIFLQGNPVE